MSALPCDSVQTKDTPGPDSASGFFRGRWRLAVAAGVLVLLTAAAYGPCLENGFIWDDDNYVYENRTLLSPEGLRQIWFEVDATPQYYPVVHTSYWLEYRLWGLDPTGYHVTNILLHGLGAVLLWLLLRRLEVPAAWAAAALFALHPVHVESVAWVTERKNVLSAVFYLGAALAYCRFALPGRRPLPESDPSAERGRIGFYIVSLVLFVCALLSKSVTCTLPAALLLVLWWKRPHLRWRDLAPLAPLFVIGVGQGLLTVHLEKTHVGAFGASWDFSLIERCLIAGRAICFYAGKLIWPAHLTFVYPRWHIDGAEAWQYGFLLLAVGVALLLWLARRRIGRGPFVAYAFFTGTLFPALGFFDVYPMKYSFVADHFQYLAGIGVIALAVAAVRRLAARLGGRAAQVQVAVLAAVLAVFGFLTWQQCKIYRDSVTLWTDTIRKNPDAFLAHCNLGVLLNQSGRPEEAMKHFTEARRIDPDDHSVYVSIGRALQEQGRYAESIEYFRKALQMNADSAACHTGCGVSLFRMGRFEEAAAEHALAVKFYNSLTGYRADSMEEAGAHNNLGIALLNLGRAAEAAAQIEAALKINPADPMVHFNLALAYRRLNRNEEALAQFEAAERLASGAKLAGFRERMRVEIDNTRQLIGGN